jgi:peptidyl-prolyl cis-trans isomerase SurA
MLKKFLMYWILIFLFSCSNSLSFENKIILKIENQIITSLDVNNEYKYLIALNPSLKDSKKKDVIKFSERSIINEKIKKIEIDKNFDNPKIPKSILENILKNVYSKIGLTSLDEFKRYLTINNINYEDIKNKLIIEALWNELIIIKFSSKIKINENDLRKRINSNKIIKSFLLSEIFFEITDSSDLDDKFKEIKNVINDKGFEFAALKYSISSTSNLGGKLDWINENSLNKNIITPLNNLRINEFTKPITLPGGFLILKINDIQTTKVEIDTNKELIKLKNYEKNNQLNQYSKIYFNKIKKNLEISEL